MRKFARNIAKRSFRMLLHSPVGLPYVRTQHAQQLRILTYHRLSPNPSWGAAFEAHCRHLAKYYSPVTLMDAAHWIREGTPLPPNACAVTFDDGYRDVLTVAAPVLKRYGIPATVFLIGNFLDRSEWMWWDRVQFIIQRTRHQSITLAAGAGEPHVFRFRTDAERLAAANAMCERLKRLPDPEMRKVVAALDGDLDVAAPAALPEEYCPLTWDECRTLQLQGIEFGSHTMNHPILPMLASQAEIDAEIYQSRRLIQERLQAPVDHFCHPNGSLDARSELAVRTAGFTTAVTVRYGLNTRHSDPLSLSRLSVDPAVAQMYFEEALAGFRVPVL